MRFILILVVGWSAVLAEGGQVEIAPDFDQTVAPILARRCLDCHSGAQPKGKLDLSRRGSALGGGVSGAVLIPGEPEESLLWMHVEDGTMPPEQPLVKEEADILRAWIAGGANWGSDPIDIHALTVEHRAGRDWWSLGPLQRPEVPSVQEGMPAVNPIDEMLLERLHAVGLEPAAEADRRVLIRRVAFDLTGIPPTPEDVDSFVADDRADAYERMVDRYLASDQYGVRWARAWLDLARFGESNGFEHDEFRPDAWRYRDWLVWAFNTDMPYDDFARYQLAGDVLEPAEPLAVEATGFLVAGSYDSVGQSQQSQAMKQVVRQDELEDIVGTVSQTFLGLTVHCARCHDHKFDPILQADYYRMASALDGVRHGVRDLSEFDAEIVAARGLLGELSARLDAIEGPVRDRLRGQGQTLEGASASPRPVARWEFDRVASDSQAGLAGELRGAARIEGGNLWVDGTSGYVATAPLTQDLKAKTLEAWVRLNDLRQQGGGVMSIQTTDGSSFDAIVFGEREPGRWMAGSEGFSRTRPFGGPIEEEADIRLVQIVLVYEADGTISAYREGKPYGTPYRSASGPKEFKAGATQVLFGLRHGEPGGNRMLAGRVARACLYDRALGPEEVAASALAGAPVDPQVLSDALSPELRAERKRVLAEIERVKARLSSPRKAYAVVPRQPGVTHLLIRGDTRQPAQVVSPGGLSALAGLVGEIDLDPEAPDAERRKRLANWIASPKNPLFARVIVNRIWRSHFGVGFVETPSDLGYNGGQPSHPELLDWLATDLIEHGWSLKHLHRRILFSSAYRQSSRLDDRAAEVDAGNRLLWRRAPWRLEAEMVRDAMLAVSGDLDTSLGGPGFREFEMTKALGTTTMHYQPTHSEGPGQTRRTLYRTWARGGRSGFLDALDCPDPSTTAPVRAVTNTPLQALSMMNNAMVLDLADQLAERLRREVGPDRDSQVERLYRLAFGRMPNDVERSRASQVAASHGLEAVCRAIFNSNEFLFID